ncbi:MAG TPA: hypothetical protein DCM67_09415 [Propionibacteriaceae bacterium]|nr:hypothetical protein [Propionibacteriaceae bacterium]
MSDFYGANPSELRELATTFDAQSTDLLQWRAALGSRVKSGLWVGPRADAFNRDWDGKHDQLLRAASQFLVNAARSLRENADQQDQASSAGEVGPGTGGGQPPQGSDDALSSALGWFADRGEAIGDAFGDVAEGTLTYWDAAFVPYFRLELPRFTEVVSSNIAASLNIFSAAVTLGTVGIVDLNLGDDGEPYAGTPQALPGDVPSFDNLQSVMAQTVVAYDDGPGQIRVTTIVGPDGQPKVIVSVPGTETWNPLTGDNPMDGTGNFVTAGGGRSTLTEAVALAMANANIPPGAQVMMVGHSQGGMSVADLVSDPDFVSQYNVTNAVTFGSPIDSDQIDARVHVMEIQHGNDWVPVLDLQNSAAVPVGPVMVPIPGSVPEVNEHHFRATLPSPGGPFDVLENHNQANYLESVANNPNPVFAAYEDQLRESGFLGGVTQDNVTIHVGRKD